MNTTCNYRCSYCTQRFMEDRGRWAREVPRFLAGLGALPGRWEAKLSGGEPFLHPQFHDVVRGLSQRGTVVSVVTNFSSPDNDVEVFLDAAGPNLGVISASLHLEYVGDEPALTRFLLRCDRVRSRLPPGASLCVTCVATRDNLPRLPPLSQRFTDRGLVFKVQPQKRDRDVIPYSPAEVELLKALGGHNTTGYLAPCFRGRPCWAGSRSFILDDRGNAFRCYPARRRRSESLGNLLEGPLALRPGPTPCLYDYCNCTVPISRGMMPTADAPDGRDQARRHAATEGA
jgi:MoaA/NifB/PqqE/SkfB family radical SAM enzyme